MYSALNKLNTENQFEIKERKKKEENNGEIHFF